MMAAAAQTGGIVSSSPSAVLVSNEQPMATNQLKSGLTGEVPTSVTY